MLVQVGRYTLIAHLAQGGMGEVYLGVAQGPAGFSKLMVIKMLRPALADDERFLAMFLDEARLAARLAHANIVQTVEVGAEGHTHFLAMEYLEGQTLRRLRSRLKERFPLGAHLRVLIEALHGLHYAHELVDIDGRPLHIVHRDATPANLFVTYDGQVKVVDFGIAKAMDSSAETRTGELKGKIAYMPPEQATGQPVDRRADVFSVGVMVWEAAVGRRMWTGSDVATMHELIEGRIPSPRDADANVPAELDAICRRALAPKPEDRYPTAQDLAAALEQYLASVGDHTEMRDVARLLGEAFDADRREQRAVIDDQLRQLRAGAAHVAMRTLSPPASVGPAPAPAPPRKKRPVVIAAVVAGALGGVVAIGLIMWHMALWVADLLLAPGPVAAAASVFTVPPPSASASTAASVESVSLTVTATPPDAKLFLDDAPLGPSPFHASLPRDGLAHRVHAEAPLYSPRTELVTFDKPTASVDLTLVKAPRKR